MEAQLFCRACGAALSDRLTIFSTKDSAVRAPEMIDKQPICRRGMAYKSYEPLMRSLDPERPASLEFVPQFWMNPGDVEDHVELVDIACRLNGCCGLDGCGGPNMRCKNCKAEAVTTQSDCWTPYIFVPDPEQAELRKTES